MSGGVARVELADGRTVVVKDGPTVAAEAAGLRWLAVPGGPPVPQVLGCDDGQLVTTYVPNGRASTAAAAELGRRLAVLHSGGTTPGDEAGPFQSGERPRPRPPGAGAPAFGAGPPGTGAQAWIGRAPMTNTPSLEWAPWYAEHRVAPYLRTARDSGDLTADEAAVIERVCARLPELAGPPEPPARLHGDLWSGNVLWAVTDPATTRPPCAPRKAAAPRRIKGTDPAADGAWLIDPAAHGGHRETDLAMLALFGCPHLDTVVAAYDAATPLAPGWRARIPLHQLFPLLVHVVLFGRGYAGQAVAAARAALQAA
jgi:fructosamine-3-kinase